MTCLHLYLRLVVSDILKLVCFLHQQSLYVVVCINILAPRTRGGEAPGISPISLGSVAPNLK